MNEKKYVEFVENEELPPTSVTIQSGVAKLIIANISAAMKNDALIVVNRSILVVLVSIF